MPKGSCCQVAAASQPASHEKSSESKVYRRKEKAVSLEGKGRKRQTG